MKSMGSPKCPVCTKAVYPVEMATYNNTSYHKNCLRCCEAACKKLLSPSQCQLHQGKIYCMMHYRKAGGGTVPVSLAQKQAAAKPAAAAPASTPSVTTAAAKPAAKPTAGAASSAPKPAGTGAAALAKKPGAVPAGAAPAKSPSGTQGPKKLPGGTVITPALEKKMLAPSTGSLSQRVFQKYDEDGDGSIGVENLKKMCMEMGSMLSDEELAMAVKVMDTDGNGTIEFDEFERWWRQESRFERLRRSEAEMAFLNGAFASFMSFDTDGNGTIDRQEFTRLHQVISTSGYPTHDEETDWFDMDRDGNGVISFNEYVEWLFWKASEAANPKVQVTGIAVSPESTDAAPAPAASDAPPAEETPQQQ